MVVDSHQPAQQDTPEQRKGREIGKHLSNHQRGAEHEMVREAYEMMAKSSEQQNGFYSTLKDSAGPYLRKLEISGDVGSHNLKVTMARKDGKVEKLYDQDSKEQAERSIGKSEGPYDPLKRQHPDWDQKKLIQEARNFKTETGRESFNQGEQLRANADGSVTSRRQNGENYKEITSKDGKEQSSKTHTVDDKGGFTDLIENKQDGSRTVHEEDRHGNYTEKSFDKGGTLKGSKTHEINRDESKTDTERDGAGYLLRMRDTKPDGSFFEQTRNSDGSVTKHSEDKAGNYIERNIKAHKITGVKVHVNHEDGSKADIELDQNGDLKTLRDTNSDGSNREGSMNSDGSMTLRQQEKGGKVTEQTIPNAKSLFDNPIPLSNKEWCGKEKTYKQLPINLDDPHNREPLVKLSDYGISNEEFYARTDGNNYPYNHKVGESLGGVEVRQSVAERLAKVKEELASFGREVHGLDGYRPIKTQTDLLEHFMDEARGRLPSGTPEDVIKAEALKTVSNPASFDRNDPHTWPTHITGGAIDATLHKDGQPVPMGGYFDQPGAVSSSAYYEHSENQNTPQAIEAQFNRRLLYNSMVRQGFASNPNEWWHFDYGTQMAVRSKRCIGEDPKETAFYGATDP